MNTLELAAFSAWPARENLIYKGWHLRFDQGYTKRANSANTSPSACELGESDLDHVEQCFQSRGLSPVFRITSDATVQETEDRLTRRDYRLTDLSWVMTVTLDNMLLTPPLDDTTEMQAWLSGFQAITKQSDADHDTHLGILKRIDHPIAFAMQTDIRHQPVCCGLAVLVGDQLGLFDIATRPDQRGHGLAHHLCRQLLAWGRKQGASTAFLQVLASNTPAITLYERLGFRRAYHYGYRIKP